MADGSNGLTYASYDMSQGATTLAQNQLNNQNQQYQSFLSNMPSYQANMNSQALDQGYNQYNNKKESIDRSANSRGLLYSGLKQGAESSAANEAAEGTQGQIAQNNANLSNYANQYGNQVASANIGNYNTQVQNSLQQYGYGLQQQGQQNQFLGGLLGGIGSVGALAFSDEKLKDDVKDADKESDDMMSNMSAKSFSYKEDPDKKKQLGILAQDLEKSPMGKSIVVETPKGKAVDIAKALSAVMAVQSMMHKRLKKAEA